MANGHGGKRPGAGRKPKEVSESMIERLTPYEDGAIEKLAEAIERGEAWAVKLFFEYRWGKPVQRTELTGTPGLVTVKSDLSWE